MPTHVALLRAVNVGGTGKLPMATLAQLCHAAGFAGARTYIASGNVLLTSPLPDAAIAAALSAALATWSNKPIGVLVRTAAALQAVVAQNPYAHAPANRVMVLFTDDPLPPDPLATAKGRTLEQIALGPRALYTFYPEGMAQSRLRLPAEQRGTARNMNTVTKLAALAGAIA